MPVTAEKNALDALNVINLVTNNTPWGTGDLVAFLAPYLVKLSFTNIVIENHQPRPGTKRADQKLVKIQTHYNDDTRLTIAILSPKRAAARSELLDRLSLADDLEPHETRLPGEVLTRLDHALTKRAKTPSEIGGGWSCEYAVCTCILPPLMAIPIIKGDTKARTHKEKPLAELRRKLVGVEQSVGHLQKRLDLATKRRDLLIKRINKAEAK